MRYVVAIALTLIIAPGLSLATKLTLERSTYHPGETIVVGFSTPGDLPDNAWIGLVPSDVPHGEEAVNDKHDLAYRYLRGKTSGSVEFTAPDKPGSYDFRLNDTDSNGKELTHVTFTVADRDLGGASLRLERNSFVSGQEITVHFTTPDGLPDNAWIGIIPSDIPHGDEAVNDRHDLAYQYLRGATSGSKTFRAPVNGGSYDFRLHSTDSSGKELASVSFTVTAELDADEIARQLEEKGKISVYGIRFETNQATISQQSAAALAEVGQLLIKNDSLSLRIEGHTDSTGQASYNLDLSQRRAESVKDYLITTFGIDGSRLTTRGLGDTQPVASNETDEGRAQNRRVELVKQ